MPTDDEPAAEASTSTTSPVRRVAVVGSGTIGASWAACFVAAGLEVTCTDPAPDAEERLRTKTARALDTLAELGPVPTGALSALRYEPDLAAAVSEADLVQECAPEREELKMDLFARLDAVAPTDALLVSSSSGFLPSRIQSACQRPERCLVGHPFNPPHLMALVEVVGGERTGPASLDRAMTFYRSVGKRPILLRREAVGHVANRLQAAVFREALHLVASGVVDPGDVDAAMVDGLGPRWALMGPFLTFHLAGGDGGIRHFVDHLTDAYNAWFADLGDEQLSATLAELVVAGVTEVVGDRSVEELAERRDAFLVALRRLAGGAD
jgi:3-hydroxyacyl-CoA dehydrogenase